MMSTPQAAGHIQPPVQNLLESRRLSTALISQLSSYEVFLSSLHTYCRIARSFNREIPVMYSTGRCKTLPTVIVSQLQIMIYVSPFAFNLKTQLSQHSRIFIC